MHRGRKRKREDQLLFFRLALSIKEKQVKLALAGAELCKVERRVRPNLQDYLRKNLETGNFLAAVKEQA